jgi:hypothetical protein
MAGNAGRDTTCMQRELWPRDVCWETLAHWGVRLCITEWTSAYRTASSYLRCPSITSGPLKTLIVRPSGEETASRRSAGQASRFPGLTPPPLAGPPARRYGVPRTRATYTAQHEPADCPPQLTLVVRRHRADAMPVILRERVSTPGKVLNGGCWVRRWLQPWIRVDMLPRWSRSGLANKARFDMTLTGILCARGI